MRAPQRISLVGGSIGCPDFVGKGALGHDEYHLTRRTCPKHASSSGNRHRGPAPWSGGCLPPWGLRPGPPRNPPCPPHPGGLDSRPEGKLGYPGGRPPPPLSARPPA